MKTTDDLPDWFFRAARRDLASDTEDLEETEDEELSDLSESTGRSYESEFEDYYYKEHKLREKERTDKLRVTEEDKVKKIRAAYSAFKKARKRGGKIALDLDYLAYYATFDLFSAYHFQHFGPAVCNPYNPCRGPYMQFKPERGRGVAKQPGKVIRQYNF